MKRKATFTAAMIMLSVILSVTGCSRSEPELTKPELINPGLTNHMTSMELDETEKTEFQLLNKPWEQYMSDPKPDYDHLKDKVLIGTEYGALVNGTPCFAEMLPDDYDGGAGEIVFLYFSSSTMETEEYLISFDSYEDLKTKLRAEYDDMIADGYPSVPADEDYNTLITLYDAIISGQTEEVEQDIISEYCESYYSQETASSDDSMYWQMDEDKVDAIKDSISEYHFYDEELDQRFVVHITLPPSYDPKQAYPALVMTDAVWRFNDVVSLYDAMEEGRAKPQYLITIGFEYDTDGWDNEVRANILCDHKKEFLDFITDNMMPYLNDTFIFDTEESTLFGHSQGGVFTHYAAFNYDRYDNKPFKNYIIGSPTFWTPYFTDVSDYSEYKTEYGYFDRCDSYDRNILITAGEKEDADYAEYYGDNDSTLEGIEHLKERFDAYGISSYRVKIYAGNHYQYVPEMLLEYITD